MRIISKFHDYYDPVQSYGMDKTCLYKRKTEEFYGRSQEFEEIESLIKPEEKMLRGRISYKTRAVEGEFRPTNFYMLFFCGTAVPVLEYYRSTSDYIPYGYEYYYYYNIDDLDQDVAKYGSDNLKKFWRSKRSPWYRVKCLQRRGALSYFESVPNSDSVMSLHHKYGVPVIMYDEDKQKVVLNPKLKDIKFYKHKDVYTCFQDINQFISGVLGGQSPPMIQISDSDRIAMHGFNEWSFRKPPKGV